MHRNKLQIFADSADIGEISKIDFIQIDGVTTNPSLAAKTIGQNCDNGKCEAYKIILKQIAEKIPGPISAEVIATEYSKMMIEALDLSKIAKNIIIKLPITRDGLKACKELSFEHNIDVNMTLCFTAAQATLVAINGAKYVSPFIGRLDDIGLNGMDLIRDIKKIYDNYQFPTKILAASLRNINHVLDVMKIGVDAMTMSPLLIESMFKHILTDKGIECFLNDWNK